MQYDKELSISTGRSRKEKNWKNGTVLWSAFVEKLAKEHRTAETFAEYMKADKARQDEIKDVGGFVGGSLADGRRKAGTVVARSLITLDADSADPHLWDDWLLYYGNAAVCYSTHKHSPDKPRLRLVVPTDRDMLPDEYEPCARRVASVLGINQFDDTTYEAERLMYWPSTPRDAEYYFRSTDAPLLRVDDLLTTYRDWHDASEWPVSDRMDRAVRREIKKQADPLEKPGVVGAFCRTYGIHRAIATFLSDVYEPCTVENRYTYIPGSTAAGLIVYDDKFAYSHHGTDPTSGMLCNAFDLVRVHLFGDRDENVERNGTRKDRYPSFIAMEELACRDKEVKKTIAAEKRQSVEDDFGEIDAEEGEADDGWLESMDIDKRGNFLPTANNIGLILENDPRLKGCFAYDLFNERKALPRMPPWRKDGDTEPFIRDDDEAGLRVYMAGERWGIEARQKVADGLELICRRNAFHPVRDYFDGLRWDGTERLDRLLVDYLGAEDTELNRTVTRLIFTAAVYRTYEPGTKFDQMVVLVGRQGCGKSTLIERMAVKREWFSNSLPSPDKPEEAARHLRGKFIIEIGELVGFRKAEVEAIKNFLSKTADDFHAPYGKNDVHRPRQCVFFATTNEETFLRDSSGERRYWPVRVAVDEPRYNLWDDLTPETVGQLWAEAIHYYKRRISLVLPRDLGKAMEAVQEEYKEVDEWQGIIAEYLDRKLPADWPTLGQEQRRNYFLSDADPTYQPATMERRRVCVAEVMNECPNLGTVYKDKWTANRIGKILNNLKGWKRIDKSSRFGIYGVQKGWERKHELADVEGKGSVTNVTIF